MLRDSARAGSRVVARRLPRGQLVEAIDSQVSHVLLSPTAVCCHHVLVGTIRRCVRGLTVHISSSHFRAVHTYARGFLGTLFEGGAL